MKSTSSKKQWAFLARGCTVSTLTNTLDTTTNALLLSEQKNASKKTLPKIS
jgi:hypothetical protein